MITTPRFVATRFTLWSGCFSGFLSFRVSSHTRFLSLKTPHTMPVLNSIPILNMQLKLLDLSVIPNAWIGTGIKTLGLTPLSCCFWMNITQSVLESLCHSTFQPALPLLPRLLPLGFLTAKSHMLCASVSGVFSQEPLVSSWICQTNMHCSTNYWPHGLSTCSLGTYHISWARHGKRTTPHPTSSLINSILVRRPCLVSLYLPCTGPCDM